ncbi:MAG: sulfurtransferase complex subunit TusB [Halobacteria archaeon]|nr:sulfurtransferase complex subunit TusB [Halobacteria archaeon]
MSMLHLVNKSPHDGCNLDTATSIMKDGDSLLLIEDGVYGAIKAGKAASLLEGRSVSVLGPDLAARGISEDKLVDGITIVDYAGFVDMVAASDNVQSWL